MTAEKKHESLEPLLFTADDLCALLRIKRTKIYSMLSAGQLPPSITIGRCRRWRRDDVERWIQLGCPSLEKFIELNRDSK